MQNKIIAVICVLLLLVTLFAACGKKVIIQGKNGQEYVAMTDEEGNTVLNQSGEIVVYVTDDRGKYVTDANGERQTNAVTFPDVAIGKDKIETADYVLTIPEGWISDKDGKLHQKDHDQISLYISNSGSLAATENLDSYFLKQKQYGEELIASLKEEYPNSEINAYQATLAQQNLDCRYIESTAKDDNGAMVFHSITLYFVYNNEIFTVAYTNEGVADETVDVLELLSQNLSMR